ncbi:hypothetical protein ONE63_003009 [Megalurothrips usitatus]|uniref:small monomeric GTPase n=1 Tax=Megalurothrips usitatus TaxID=439358 RepID=A0AAV7XA71_9NEOP|nr:hypothetical protein ONE63_003009 [Megalurothrips usitatus]
MTPSEASQLAADGVVVVYSITDRESFRYAQRVLDLLNGVRGLPVTLMANKADLAHLRTVEHCEGRALADGAGASFYEVSVAEDSAGLYQAFELLVGECHAQLCTNNNNNNNGLGDKAGSRTRKFSVTKMLGTLIGAAKGSSPPPSPPSGTAAASGQGTVIVCQKSDLYRTGVLKRRHKTSASASL